MSEPLKYLFDEMDKQQNETIKNLDKINRMLGGAAEEGKEEVLPSQIKQCEFCKNPAANKIMILEAEDFDEEGRPDAYRVGRWMCDGHIWEYENREGIFDPYKYL